MFSRIKKYVPFFKGGAISLFVYKFNFITWLFITFLEIGCVFFLWSGVYKSSPNGVDSVINGFTFHEILTYSIFINIFNFVSFTGETLWTICDEIQTGTIAMSFVKPISYRKRFIATTLGSTCMSILILGLPCFVITYIVFYLLGYIVVSSVWMLIIHILLFLISQLFSILLMDVINYICGVLCFYTTAAWGMNSMRIVIINFLSGTLIPISFFPRVMKNIITYSPFAGISQNPVLILLMKLNVADSLKCILISAIWYIALELLAMLLFNRASKKVTVQGG